MLLWTQICPYLFKFPLELFWHRSMSRFLSHTVVGLFLVFWGFTILFSSCFVILHFSHYVQLFTTYVQLLHILNSWSLPQHGIFITKSPNCCVIVVHHILDLHIPNANPLQCILLYCELVTNFFKQGQKNITAGRHWPCTWLNWVWSLTSHIVSRTYQEWAWNTEPGISPEYITGCVSHTHQKKKTTQPKKNQKMSPSIQHWVNK